MNRLDNLPDDIIKKINRKVEDLHIKERKIERKKNRALLKHKKQIEYNWNWFVYRLHLEEIKKLKKELYYYQRIAGENEEIEANSFFDNCLKKYVELKKIFNLYDYIDSIDNLYLFFLEIELGIDKKEGRKGAS